MRQGIQCVCLLYGLNEVFFIDDIERYATSHVVYFGAYETAKQGLAPFFKDFELNTNKCMLLSFSCVLLKLHI